MLVHTQTRDQQCRHSYAVENLVWDHTIAPCVTKDTEGKCTIDFTKFHDIRPAPPDCIDSGAPAPAPARTHTHTCNVHCNTAHMQCAAIDITTLTHLILSYFYLFVQPPHITQALCRATLEHYTAADCAILNNIVHTALRSHKAIVNYTCMIMITGRSMPVCAALLTSGSTACQLLSKLVVYCSSFGSEAFFVALSQEVGGV
jgi:hypothetical protein